MSIRSSIRFMQKEQMKEAGFEKLCKPNRYDGVNQCYRSAFAMHWKDFPDMKAIPIILKRKPRHTRRNLNARKAAMAQ